MRPTSPRSFSLLKARHARGVPMHGGAANALRLLFDHQLLHRQVIPRRIDDLRARWLQYPDRRFYPILLRFRLGRLRVDRLRDRQYVRVLHRHQVRAQLLLQPAPPSTTPSSPRGPSTARMRVCFIIAGTRSRANALVQLAPVGRRKQQHLSALPLLVPHPPVPAERLEEGQPPAYRRRSSASRASRSRRRAPTATPAVARRRKPPLAAICSTSVGGIVSPPVNVTSPSFFARSSR